MTASSKNSPATRIVVFQQQGSGENKIAGIREYGRDIEISSVINIDISLPDLIDEPEDVIPDDFSGDLALSFLKHPDLVEHLAGLCKTKSIPLIASGQKIKGAITPFT